MAYAALTETPRPKGAAPIRHVAYDNASCFTVTASLPAGVRSPDTPWPWLLDGLLAGQTRTETVGLNVADHHTVSLPLTKVGGRTGRWWWCATAGMLGPSIDTVEYATQRTDTDAIHRISGTTVLLNTGGGRYKHGRKPVRITHTTDVTWRAIGCPERVAEILAGVDSIGGRRGIGYGRLDNIEITVRRKPDTKEDAVRWLLFDSGTIARPVPPLGAGKPSWAGIPTDPDLSYGPTRPPYWRPGFHDGRRQNLPVVAPGTVQA